LGTDIFWITMVCVDDLVKPQLSIRRLSSGNVPEEIDTLVADEINDAVLLREAV
jgi:hypothetical protein